ncbi:MAG: universal stress protein, partial [Vicinamibacterales bacterium]
MFQHILCPVDFSAGSLNALSLAGSVARAHGAQLTALHVRPLSTPNPETPPVGFDAPAVPGELDAVRRQLEEAARDRVGAGVDVDVAVTTGDPVDGILECAQARAIDLLVMGTHGTAGFRRLLLGSVTEKVLRKASCAVLTVPPNAHVRTARPFTHLLAAVDFSDCSLRAATVAASVATAAGATLTLMHVLEWPWHETSDTTLQGMPEAQAKAAAEYRRYLEAAARERLDALAESAMPGHQVNTRVAVGRSYREILDAANEAGADLLVLGVRGRGPVDLAFFGSTANHLVRSAGCPVLTVRES